MILALLSSMAENAQHIASQSPTTQSVSEHP
jgi:hypothetical protein